MAYDTFAPLPKPLKGSAQLARVERKAAQKRCEAAILREVKRRDRGCRYPGCRLPLVLHAAHLRHRGMGGNPSGDRTTRDQVITLCARHHDWYDRLVAIDIAPLTPRGTDGPCEFFRREGDDWICVGRERSQQISEERNPS